MAIEFVNRSAGNSLQPASRTAPVREGQAVAADRDSGAQSGGLSTSRQGVPAGSERTARAVVDLNDYVQRVGREIHFSVDDDSGQTVIKVMNAETKEVIRQIPPDEVLALAEFLQESREINSTGFSEKA